VSYLNQLAGAEVAIHGFEHAARGSRLAVEFANKNRDECAHALCSAKAIFSRSGLTHVPGFSPPG
jgi:predicted deacetylase